ncbi:unnamed protein product, partial [Tetraodon nigroviridis]
QTSEAEKQFLKDLYSYMKKRGSPIERIPNLGFKQSDGSAAVEAGVQRAGREPPQHQRRHLHTPPLRETAPAQEPLDHLRYLAECYKNSSGLTEPLNLSVKGPRREPDSKPTSSFSTPLPSKNPKFLNKPSPLYTIQCSQATKSERRETRSDEAGSEGPSHPFTTKVREAYADDAASSSTAYTAAAWGQTDIGADLMVPKLSSPKTDCIPQVKENASRSPDVSELAQSPVLPGLPRQNQEGEMEIEVPLSLLCNWLKACKPQVAEREANPEDLTRQRRCSEAEDQPTQLDGSPEFPKHGSGQRGSEAEAEERARRPPRL